MKKILALIFVLIMMLSLAACTNEKVEDTSSEPDKNVTVENEAETENPQEETEENEEETKEEDKLSEEDKKPVDDKNTSEDKKPAGDKKPAEDKKPADDKNNTEDKKPADDKNNTEDKKPAETNTTLGNRLLSEFKAVAGSGNALAVAEKLSAYSELSVFPMGAMSVEPGLLNGFDNAEITGFSEGATFAPMMGTIPFVGYVFTLEEGVSASDFIAKLKESANLRWNICTTAEEMVAGSFGNKVFFVMCNKSLEE